MLISIDTLRADHLGCYGYDRPTSPTLDALAESGLLFEDATSPSPWTLPTHASLLTGLYPSRHGVKSPAHQLPSRAATLARVLKEHGFVTAAFVNSYYLDRKYGFARGFDDFVHVWEHVDRDNAAEVVDDATRWIAKRGGDRFLLFLHLYDVHSDYAPRAEYRKLFVRPYAGSASGRTAQLLEFRRGQAAFDESDIVHLVDLYDAGIRQVDDLLAQLLDSLEQHRAFDDTLIVVTSDHGEELLDHGGVLHGRTLFQELIRVPLIVSGPGIPAARRVAEMVSLVDVMPTVLGLLAIPPPFDLDGVDLRPLWQEGGTALASRFIFSEADHNNVHEGRLRDDIKRAVRHSRFKLHYDRLTGAAELYDLVDDPGERIDVGAARIEMADLLRKQLDEFERVQRTGMPVGPLPPEDVEILKSLGYLQ